jgi:hypothetical protein
MAARTPPEAWYWSYDIQAPDIDSILVPGAQLTRLMSYRKGTRLRYAALAHKVAGPARSYELELGAEAVHARSAAAGARPIALAVDTGEESPRFTLLLDPAPGPAAEVRVDLDEARLRAALDDRHRIVDLVTYAAGGARRFAAILEERVADGGEPAAAQQLLIGVSAAELDEALLRSAAALVRLRGYTADGRSLFAAVAEPAPPSTWSWYADLDPDEVAQALERNGAYPLDLDVSRDERGLRFSVVMYRDR